MRGILGGVFDPPHNGHVALAEGAAARFELDRLLVLVAAQPGHRGVVAPADVRLRLAVAAFGDHAGTEIELDEHRYTVDSLRERRLDDALFVVGADEGAAFPTWREPQGVLEWARLAVGTRSGYADPELISRFGNRVVAFEIDSPPISASEIRERVAAGLPIGGLVPPAVEALIDELGLYRASEGPG